MTWLLQRIIFKNQNSKALHSLNYVLLKCIICILYIAIGTCLFNESESTAGKAIIENVESLRSEILQQNPSLSKLELQEFIKKIVDARRNGIDATLNVTHPRVWTLSNSLLFSVSLLTTIGYGNVLPLSDTGKIFCIFYGVLGIPATCVFLTATASKLLDYSKYIYSKLRMRYPLFESLLVFRLSAGCFILALVVLLPALIFAAVEPGWNYLNAVYYSYISVSTIGLGDFIPGDAMGQKHRGLYKVVTCLYLLVGVILMLLLYMIIDVKSEWFKDFEDRADNNPKQSETNLGEREPLIMKNNK